MGPKWGHYLRRVLNRLDLRGRRADDPAFLGALPRPQQPGEGPVAAVREVLHAVQTRGDDAVRELTRRFDGVDLETLRVSPEEIAAARATIDPEVLAALELAAANVDSYHRGQAAASPHPGSPVAGCELSEIVVPVGRAGCYVPGGRAAYPSTVLMTAIPARAAGVHEVVLCTPPAPSGSIPAVTLAAAAVAGVDEVYAVGGAQAIAAMAYGTESIAPVDVIVGPGNMYVAVAKREVASAGVVGVPSAFTGPSEVVVVADQTAPARWAAIDIAVQAEHGPDGLAWLVCWSNETADAITAALTAVVEESPRRAEISATLATSGYAVVVDGPREAMAVANAIAPEHLQLMVDDPASLLADVHNAGAVFLGAWSPASLGDYVAGPSHVLPTSGSARFGSALRVDDFRKHVHVVDCNAVGFAALGPALVALASAEGLVTHALSGTERLAAL